MKTLIRNHAPYRRFTNDRDRALEGFLNNSRKRMSSLGTHAFKQILQAVHYSYSLVHKEMLHTLTGKRMIDSIESHIEGMFTILTHGVVMELEALRKRTYLLTYASEQVALQRVKKVKPQRVDQNALKQAVLSELPEGDKLLPRVELIFRRLKRKILDAIELSRVMEESPAEMIVRVRNTLPPVLRYKRPPKVVREAAYDDAAMGLGKTQKQYGGKDFMNDSEWEELKKEYKEEFIPFDRSGKSVFDLDVPGYGGEYTEEWYDWEVEQQTTHDFLQKFNDTKQEGGDTQGIEDYVWIALTQPTTCEDCRWRDGLMVSEIAARLESDHADDEDAGEYSGSELPAPPVHFGCNCTIAPVMEGAPEPEAVDFEGFEQWINS